MALSRYFLGGTRSCARSSLALRPALMSAALRPALGNAIAAHFASPCAALHTTRTRHSPLLPSNPLDQQPGDEDDTSSSSSSSSSQFRQIMLKSLESACVMFASVAVIGLAGLAYQQYYHAHAISKMENAFFPERLGESGKGHHPLSGSCAESVSRRHVGSHQDADGDEAGVPAWVERPEQELLDAIVSGKKTGRYYLLIGEKGTGKTSMILEAMRRAQGQYCTMFDAHPDPEIFRIRLGQALNFEFFEDYIGGMFSLRGPRDTTALLDIERAFNKLEHVATTVCRRTGGRPLVLVINNVHMIRDDELGQHLIELLQQKAESLAGAATIVFNSDDYWVYERLKKLGTRLEVVTVQDMSRAQAMQTLHATRARVFGHDDEASMLSEQTANDIYNLVGGRPQHLAQVAASRDAIKACHQLIDRERTWFLNQCGLLGAEMDDDVMESGKFSTSAMLLARALVEMDRQRGKHLTHVPAGERRGGDHVLPQIPLWLARRVMTRPDYIQRYDALNIFTIDKHSFCRADSVPMMQAFHEIASMPQFDELLEETCDRVSAIESLGRTRELVLKDLVVPGARYRFEEIAAASRGGKGREWAMSVEAPVEEEDDDDEGEFEKLNLNADARKWWWSKRDATYRKGSN